jgi:hypothetical protein
VPSFVDRLGIPAETRARRIGVYHLVLNLAVPAKRGVEPRQVAGKLKIRCYPAFDAW